MANKPSPGYSLTKFASFSWFNLYHHLMVIDVSAEIRRENGGFRVIKTDRQNSCGFKLCCFGKSKRKRDGL